jgi:hypothetical protein
LDSTVRRQFPITSWGQGYLAPFYFPHYFIIIDAYGIEPSKTFKLDKGATNKLDPFVL